MISAMRELGDGSIVIFVMYFLNVEKYYLSFIQFRKDIVLSSKVFRTSVIKDD